MGQESRHELCLDHRSGTEPAANGYGSQRPAPRLGTVRSDSDKPGDHIRPLRTSIRQLDRPGNRQADWRLAIERDHHLVERISVYSTDWCEPIGRREYTKSRPPGL